jgi:uncharacterized protein YcfJ
MLRERATHRGGKRHLCSSSKIAILVDEHGRETNMTPSNLGVSSALCALLLIASVAVPAAAQKKLYIFPKDGQSEEQQQRDQGECHTWAVKQTGYNPSEEGPSAQAQTRSEAGGAVKGAAVGAAGGAVIGAIAGDTGAGAAIGAVAGGLFNGMRRRDQNNKARAQADAQNQRADRNRAEYQRAFIGCLDAKGYTVK